MSDGARLDVVLDPNIPWREGGGRSKELGLSMFSPLPLFNTMSAARITSQNATLNR